MKICGFENQAAVLHISYFEVGVVVAGEIIVSAVNIRCCMSFPVTLVEGRLEA